MAERPAHPQSPDAQAQALSAEWFRASLETDDAWFEDNLAEDFRYLMGDGSIEAKGRVIEMNRLIRNKVYELSGVSGRRYGAVLVVQGTYHARGTIPEGLAPPAQIERYAAGVDVRFTSMWVGEGAPPRCVLMQATSILA
ncbi:MAG: hypothetical protein ACRDLP_00095 [Solirubrobacteraceae bacterium]